MLHSLPQPEEKTHHATKPIKIVLTGGPRSGKTTTLEAFKKLLKDQRRFHYIDEQVSIYVEDFKRKHPNENPFADLINMNRQVVRMQVEAEDKAVAEDCILDRSLLDDLAISEIFAVGVTKGEPVIQEIASLIEKRKQEKKHYDIAFILKFAEVTTDQMSDYHRLRAEGHRAVFITTDEALYQRCLQEGIDAHYQPQLSASKSAPIHQEATQRNAAEDPYKQYQALKTTYGQHFDAEHLIEVPIFNENNVLMSAEERALLMYDRMEKLIHKTPAVTATVSTTAFGLFKSAGAQTGAAVEHTSPRPC